MNPSRRGTFRTKEYQRLTANDFRLLELLQYLIRVQRKRTGKQYCTPSQQYLARKLGVVRETVSRSVKRCQDLGFLYVRRLKRGREGRWPVNMYRVISYEFNPATKAVSAMATPWTIADKSEKRVYSLLNKEIISVGSDRVTGMIEAGHARLLTPAEEEEDRRLHVKEKPDPPVSTVSFDNLDDDDREQQQEDDVGQQEEEQDEWAEVRYVDPATGEVKWMPSVYFENKVKAGVLSYADLAD